MDDETEVRSKAGNVIESPVKIEVIEGIAVIEEVGIVIEEVVGIARGPMRDMIKGRGTEMTALGVMNHEVVAVDHGRDQRSAQGIMIATGRFDLDFLFIASLLSIYIYIYCVCVCLFP